MINKQKMSVFYFSSYFMFGLVMANLIPYLNELNFNTFDRGLILSGGAIATIVFQLYMGYLSDKLGRPKLTALITLGLFIPFSFLTFFEITHDFIYNALIISIAIGLLNACCGLFDTWILISGPDGTTVLPSIKGFGSIGWALGSFFSAAILNIAGYKGISLSMIVIGSFSIIKGRQQNSIVTNTGDKKRLKISDMKTHFSNKSYIYLVFILTLIYSMVVANNNVVIDKMVVLGASAGQISMKWSMQSLLEIPTYFLGSRILLRFKSYNLLKFSTLIICVQFLGFALAKSPLVMITLSLLQIFTTPLILIASKKAILEIADPRMQNSGQLLALSFFVGVPSFIVPTLAGLISTNFDESISILMFLMIGLIALLTQVIMSTKNSDKIRNIEN